MKNSVLRFRHEVIDPEPNCSHQDVCLIADINGNGRNDIPTHEAKVGDLTGDGKPDIAGKPFQPESHIDVLFNET